MTSNLLKGTAILTVGLFLSKVLGIIYIVPFYAMVGEENIGLYQYAYIPYNLMLAAAISGAPLAFSKFVAKYNALGDYETGRRLLRSGLTTMAATGFTAFLILYIFAEPLAKLTINPAEKIYTVEDVRDAIRWISFALIIVPFMSLWRGFFQGYQYMMPTAVSQLIEQIVRIIFLLGGAFVVIYMLDLPAKLAIQVAVLSAFVGAIGGVFVLFYYWKKKKQEYNELLLSNVSTHEVGLKDMYKEIIAYGIPLVFLGMANPLFQMVDLLTFNRAMADSPNAASSDIYLGMLNLTAHKLVMIPVMLGLGFSMALIPLITKYFTLNDMKQLTRTLDQAIQMIVFLTVPAILGMIVLSDELYLLFYEKSDIGASVLANYLPAALLFSIFPVTASILQGINKQKWVMWNLVIGISTKFALNSMLIQMWETNGAIAATIIGYSVSIILNVVIIVKAVNYQSKLVIRRLLWIFVMNVAMFVVILMSKKLLQLVWEVDGKVESIGFMILIGVIGVAVYGYISLRSKIAQKLFGERLTKYTKRFGWS